MSSEIIDYFDDLLGMDANFNAKKIRKNSFEFYKKQISVKTPNKKENPSKE